MAAAMAVSQDPCGLVVRFIPEMVRAMKKMLWALGFVAALLAGLLGGKFAASLFQQHAPEFTTGDYSSQFSESGQRVVLLGTKWCGFCEKTRKHLAGFGVEYADLDIENSAVAAEMHRKLGAKGVPVLLIGNRQIRGFQPGVIDAALQALDN